MRRVLQPRCLAACRMGGECRTWCVCVGESVCADVVCVRGMHMNLAGRVLSGQICGIGAALRSCPMCEAGGEGRWPFHVA